MDFGMDFGLAYTTISYPYGQQAFILLLHAFHTNSKLRPEA